MAYDVVPIVLETPAMQYRYKVLFVLSNSVVGGTETFCFSTVPCLRALSIDARIGNLWMGSELGKLDKDVNIPYLEFKTTGRLITFRGLWQLVKLCRREQFDIIYGFGLRVSLVLRFISFLINRPILVIGVRNTDTWRRWYHIWADRLSQGLIRCFVCNSQALLEIRHSREGTGLHKLCVIVNGIDVEYFSPNKEIWPSRAELGLPNGRLLITVAHIRDTKAHTFYLDAFVRAIEMGLPEDVKCLWLGEGPLKQELMQKAERLGIADRIIWGGKPMDVRPYLVNADAFVLSSKAEGMPRALMEAMAMELPALCTNVGGVAEVLRDGIDGMIVQYGDVEAMGKGLIKLTTEWMQSNRDCSARQRICDCFAVEDIALQHVELFDQLLKRRDHKHTGFGVCKNSESEC